MRRRRGFTLLEVLVATTIMAVAVGTLLASLTTSLRNASRVTDTDRAAMLAKRTMDELLVLPWPSGQIEQRFDPREVNLDGGWRARREPFAKEGDKGLDRIVLEVWWMAGGTRRSFVMEAYRPTGVPVGGPR